MRAFLVARVPALELLLVSTSSAMKPALSITTLQAPAALHTRPPCLGPRPAGRNRGQGRPSLPTLKGSIGGFTAGPDVTRRSHAPPVPPIGGSPVARRATSCCRGARRRSVSEHLREKGLGSFVLRVGYDLSRGANFGRPRPRLMNTSVSPTSRAKPIS